MITHSLASLSTSLSVCLLLLFVLAGWLLEMDKLILGASIGEGEFGGESLHL